MKDTWNVLVRFFRHTLAPDGKPTGSDSPASPEQGSSPSASIAFPQLQSPPLPHSDKQASRRLRKIHALLDEVTSSPWSHDVIELVMAVIASIEFSLAGDTAFVWLIIVGLPSGDKTASVLLFKGAHGVLYVDNLTENALASGYVAERGKKRKPDLLQLIEQTKAKAVIVKDLTTLFSLNDERVKKLLGELQSIYDGEYTKATGTLGVLHYTTRFPLIACITPIVLTKHHKYMSFIGPRFLFYRLPRLTEEERKVGLAFYRGKKEYQETRKAKLAELRKLVAEQVERLLQQPVEPVVETPEQQEMIDRLAELLAHGRAGVAWRKAPFGEWEIDQIQIEEPFRAVQQLRNLGWAVARVHDRTCLTDHELELLRRCVLSSMPVDRADVLTLFQAHPEGVTVKECADLIGKSEDRARQLLYELVRLDLVVKQAGQSQGGSPPAIYLPSPKFEGLLTKPVKPLDHLADLGGDFSDKSPPKDT